MKWAALLLPLPLLAAAPSAASVQSAGASAAEPSSEAVTAALELFSDLDLEQQMLAGIAQGIDVSLQGQLAALQADGRDVPEKVVIRLRELLGEEGKLVVRDMMPTIRMEYAAIYARRFSAAELRELKKLQDHPVMKKAQRLMPEMFGEMGRIGMKAAAARQPALKKKIDQMLVELMAEEQAAAPGPST